MRLSRFAALGATTLMAATLASCADGALPVVTVTATGSGASPGATPVVTSTPPPPPPPAHVYVFGDELTTASSDGAQGSGCSPGVGLLPDGVWFGFTSSWSTTQISFDMACWWSGTEAVAQAAARGDEVNNDYYITNDNTTIRLVTVDGDIPAKKAAWDDGVFTLTQVMADPGGSLPTGPAPYLVWIYVNGGVVTELAVQYTP